MPEEKEKGIDFKKERADLIEMLLQTKRICKAILDSAEKDPDSMSGTMLAQILNSFKLIDSLLKEGEKLQVEEQRMTEVKTQRYDVPFPVTKTMERDKEGELSLILPDRK